MGSLINNENMISTQGRGLVINEMSWAWAPWGLRFLPICSTLGGKSYLVLVAGRRCQVSREIRQDCAQAGPNTTITKKNNENMITKASHFPPLWHPIRQKRWSSWITYIARISENKMHKHRNPKNPAWTSLEKEKLFNSHGRSQVGPRGFIWILYGNRL